jgi:hypothetical protein
VVVIASASDDIAYVIHDSVRVHVQPAREERVGASRRRHAGSHLPRSHASLVTGMAKTASRSVLHDGEYFPPL